MIEGKIVVSNLKKYNEVFIEIFQVDENELNASFSYEERREWDSMAHFSLISELESVFDIIFETEDILHYESFNNGIKILEKYGISFK